MDRKKETVMAIPCDVPRRNLHYRLQSISSGELYDVRALLGTRDPAAGSALRGAMKRAQELFDKVKAVCSQRDDKCCQVLRREVRAVYDEAKYLHDLVERQAGEERMREGYFGDLGRYPWKPRTRGGPRCRRIWVRGHKRISNVRVD